MKSIFLTFTLAISMISPELSSKEAFVVIENQSSNSSFNENIDRYNPFLKDSNYSKVHLVKEGESLSSIIKKYYSNTGLNMRIVEISIIELNKKAFVRNNPHYLFAGKKLNVDIYLNKKIQNIKTNRSIALSSDNFDYLKFQTKLPFHKIKYLMNRDPIIY